MNEQELKQHFQNLAIAAGKEIFLTEAVMTNLENRPEPFWKFWLRRMLESLFFALGVLAICILLAWILGFTGILPSSSDLKPLFSIFRPGLAAAFELEETGELLLVGSSLSFTEILARGILPVSAYLLGLWLFFTGIGMDVPRTLLEARKEKNPC